MSRPAGKPNPAPDVKVLILSADGLFLTGGGADWTFTGDRSRAAVFSYTADRVAEQLEKIRLTQGIILQAVPVPLEEIYETCDRCKELFTPMMTFFDGKHFICPDCRGRAARRAARPRA